jgi:exopolysaccharide biosynthesis operon protein EpsL
MRRHLYLTARQVGLLGLSTLIIWGRSTQAAEENVSQAAAENVFRPYVDFVQIHSDNILLAPDDASDRTLLGIPKVSDTFSRQTVGFSYDNEIGRQHLTADLGLNHTDFDQLTQLDYSGKDFSANWNWLVGHDLEGNVGAIYIKAITPFEDFREPELNLRTNRKEFFDGAWHFHPSWRLLVGASDESLDYSLPSQIGENRNENIREYGVEFAPASRSSIGLQVRKIRDEFPNVDQASAPSGGSNSKQTELDLKISWNLSERTNLSFSGGHVERRYDLVSANDFSGFNGRATAVWSPTEKLGFTVDTWRQLVTAYDFTNLYSINHGFSIEPTWRISEKLRLLGLFKHETRNFTPDVPSSNQRQDNFQTAKLTLSYSPIRHLLLNAALGHDDLGSTFPTQTYRANNVMVNADYKF